MLATLALWVGLADAQAHPLGDRAASQSTTLVVHVDRVDVDYAADVPTAYVATARGRAPAGTGPDAADADPLAAMALELASGLLLTVDGAVVSMTIRAPSPPPAPTSEHTVGMALHLQAPLPDGPWPHRIEVSTANLQEGTNFYAGDVRVDARIPVEASGLLGVRDGRIVRDDTLRWTPGEEHRRLSVTVGRPLPAWWSVVAGLPAEPVRVGKAWVAPLPARLRPPALTPAAWLGGLGAAVLLGAACGGSRGATRAGRATAVGVVAVGVVAAWAAPARGSGWVEAVGASIASCAAATAGFAALRRSWGGPARQAAVAVAAAALAACTAAPVAGAGVAVGFAVGIAAGGAAFGARGGSRVAEGLGWCIAAAAIGALGVRAWLGLR